MQFCRDQPLLLLVRLTRAKDRMGRANGLFRLTGQTLFWTLCDDGITAGTTGSLNVAQAVRKG